MCRCETRSCVAVVVAILIGVAFAILNFADLLVTTSVGAWIAFGLGFFALLIVAIVSLVESARQRSYDGENCLCSIAKAVLIVAVVIIVLATVALLITALPLVVSLIWTFILATLGSYLLFLLYCLLACAISIHCR